MSPVLPFDILDLIIDIVGEDKDINLIKELALVSHYFLQICSKHLFATVELRDWHASDIVPMNNRSSKKGFVKLLKKRPDVVNYIRKLSYKLSSVHEFAWDSSSPVNNDDLLSPILPNILRTIPHLNYLKIDASQLDWNSLNSSLKSAFLHLIHLPTLNHINLSYIRNFPLSSLTSSVNLLRLDISHLSSGLPEFFFQSEMMPNIHEFHTSGSFWLTRKLLRAKTQDGRSAFNLVDLRRLSMSLTCCEDEQNFRYLLQNAKLLEKLHLSVGPSSGGTVVGFLSPARTLKVLDLSMALYSTGINGMPLGGLCEELDAMAGHNVLEALSCDIRIDQYYTIDIIGSVIQDMEVLVKPGWPALRQVSLKVSCRAAMMESIYRMFFEELQSLPDEYLSRLSKLDSVAFNYSVCVV